MNYIHFTDAQSAKNIVKTKRLKSAGAPFPDAVFAVAVGGANVPSVQQTKLGRAKDRNVAIIFSTEHLPDKGFPEEVLWHMESLPIQIKKIIPTKEAVELLDDSIPRDEDEVLQIPMHPIHWDEEKNDWVRK